MSDDTNGLPAAAPLPRRALIQGGVATLSTATILAHSRSQAAATTTPRVTMTAPDGDVGVELALDETGLPTWSIEVGGSLVMGPAPLGFTLDDGTNFTAGLTLTDRGEDRHVVAKYRLEQGKVSDVCSPATTRSIRLRNPAGDVIDVDLHVSSHGAAVRYRGDVGQTHRHVVTERTSFTVRRPSDGGAQFLQAYTQGSPKYQEFYIQRDDHRFAHLGEEVRSQISTADGAALPLLVRTVDEADRTWWMLAGESGFTGTYPGCHLSQPSLDPDTGTVRFSIAFPGDEEALGTFGLGAPRLLGTWQTPWRFVALGRTAAEVAQTTLATDLAEPVRLQDTSWVRPGAASFGWLTDHDSPTSLESTLPFLDLAQDMGWPYCLVDAKWDQMTDTSGAAVPLERLVAEADRRGIRLFLWYNSAGTNNDATANTPRDLLVDPVVRRREMLRLQRSGIAGIKVDGWQSDKQELLALQRDVVHDAGEHRLHVVLHNSTIPRGWDRTYPHLLGFEAGIASEYYTNTKPYSDQVPEQTTIAAVARNAIGPFDYGTTLVREFAAPGSRRLTTIAHEVALTVVLQSGFNGFADSLEEYARLPIEVREFLSEVPLAWDETRFLSADPGHHVVVARRKGRGWWVAGINGTTETIFPALDTSAPGYKAATGRAQLLEADLRPLGIAPRARLEMFADASADDPALIRRWESGGILRVPTAPFGGFAAVLIN